MRLELPGPEGRLEAILDEPEASPRVAVVLAQPHPQHGGTMHTKVVYRTAKALQGIDCAVLRFNFRGTGSSEGTFDGGGGEQADFGAALDFARARYPGLDLWAAGFSFGAWVALTVGASDPRVSVLIAIAPPVELHDFSVVSGSFKPKFFIHGEEDTLCPLKAMRAFYARSTDPKELVVLEGADHLFDGRVGEVGDAVRDLLADFGPGAGG